MTLRTVDPVLTRQALFTGRITDALTGESLLAPPRVVVRSLGEEGGSGGRLVFPSRVLPGGIYVVAGDPLSSLPTPPAGTQLSLRLTATCPGYFTADCDFVLDEHDLALHVEERTVLGLPLQLRRLEAPLVECDLALVPHPVALSLRVVESDDPGQPVDGALVSIAGAAGVGLAGRLRAAHGGDPVAVQDEATGAAVPVPGDLPEGARALPPGTPSQPPGQVLRIRSRPGGTEHATVAADGCGFEEDGLLFPHPRAATEVHRVTLTDAVGEGGGRVVVAPAPRGSAVLRLADATGLTTDRILRVGSGAAREYHLVADPAPFGPAVTGADGFCLIPALPPQRDVVVRIEHEDFPPTEIRLTPDSRQPVNERTCALTP